MNGRSERACLAIADVSGYTGYLAGVELDHAHDILADVIGTIVRTMAPFELSKLEGDAAFMTLPGDEIDGSTLQDTIEGTYRAFRRRLRDIQLASSCACDACVRIPALDLKFVVHHGSIVRQSMVGMEELVGSDVILVHRLLKNDIATATGAAAYAAYTDAIVDASGIEPTRQGLARHVEATDVAGEVELWVRDLGLAWQAIEDREPRRIDDASLITQQEWDVPTAPSVTFDWLTDAAKRVLWNTAISGITEAVADGRRGAGTTNHCMHGEDAIAEEIVEWRPPFYWLTRPKITTIEHEPAFYLSDELVPLPDGGTRVINRSGRAEPSAADQALIESLVRTNREGYEDSFARLQAKLAEIVEAAAPPVDAPVSQGRHLTEPSGVR